jgi:prevent-host-death family protein
MREVGAFEAKNKLAALLDEVERGGEVVITRRGKAVARLVSPGDAFDREGALRAVERIIANRKGRSLGESKIKDLIDEGRP